MYSRILCDRNTRQAARPELLYEHISLLPAGQINATLDPRPDSPNMPLYLCFRAEYSWCTAL